MKGEIKKLLEEITGGKTPVEIFIPEHESQGHYSTNVALKLTSYRSKLRGPDAGVGSSGLRLELAAELREKIKKTAPNGFFEKVEVAGPGFINFWISKKALVKQFKAVRKNKKFGEGKTFKGKKVMIEYTDPNPFKQFHIGHLMTNIIGEAIARLYEASGAKVLRVNYQGDVGVHVACGVWGMMKLENKIPDASRPLNERIAFLGRAYADGAKAYAEDKTAEAEIDVINKEIYARSNPAVNKLYDLGRRWSLDYFETFYARLGTKFNHYFFESKIGSDGVKVIRANPKIFVESQGAIIFEGEKYGLHNRVFINSFGLPTYEAKELGLNKKKFHLYHPDASFVVTGNEINEYFRVLKKAMEFVMPEVAAKTFHIGHGMLRLPTGKMSSRRGEVIPAESLIDDVASRVEKKIERYENLTKAEKEKIKEDVALAAIRYSILKQGTGNDIIFDVGKSISFHGDSGPYLQYTYARLKSILRKAGTFLLFISHFSKLDFNTDGELHIVRKIIEFPDVVESAVESVAPNHLAQYLFELANLLNNFYETTPIIKEKNRSRKKALLSLIKTASSVLKTGLHLLGIKTLEVI